MFGDGRTAPPLQYHDPYERQQRVEATQWRPPYGLLTREQGDVAKSSGIPRWGLWLMMTGSIIGVILLSRQLGLWGKL
jgi:hypothetical protein